MNERFPRIAPFRRRTTAAVAAVAFSFGAVSCAAETKPREQPTSTETCVYINDGEHITISLEEARRCLGTLAIKGKAPKTGYTRSQFGSWRTKDGCTTRETILIRDLTEEVVDPDNCKIISGTFDDIYTAKNEDEHVTETSVSDVEIDHVVALSDAWQSGAGLASYSKTERANLANDPLNLQATSELNNSRKSDHDASGWLPPSYNEWCSYVIRQVLVKERYDLWVKPTEHDRIDKILNDDCQKDQLLVVAN